MTNRAWMSQGAGTIGSVTATSERLNRLTRRQHGLVTAKQAVGLGMGVRQVQDRLRRGHWLAVRQGVYALAGMPPTKEQALLTAVLRAGGAAAVSHQSAGHLWAMTGVQEPERIHLVTDLAHRTRLDGVTAHRSGAIFQEDVTRSRGIPSPRALGHWWTCRVRRLCPNYGERSKALSARACRSMACAAAPTGFGALRAVAWN